MGLLQTAVEKGFKLPETKSSLFLPILRHWLEMEKGINLNTYRSNMHVDKYYFTVENKTTGKSYTSEPLYNTRGSAIYDAIVRGVDDFTL